MSRGERRSADSQQSTASVKARRIRLTRKTRSDREDARKFATKVSTGLVIVGVITALFTIANRWERRADVRSIRIIGRHVLDSGEVVPRGLIPDTIPLRSLDLAAIERRIASHPLIERAAVYRGENGTLVVDIAERTPVAATVVQGRICYVDSLGSLLPGRFAPVALDVPIIGGVDPKIVDGRVILDSAGTMETLQVMKMIHGYSPILFSQISEINRLSKDDYELVTADGAVPVRIGSVEHLESRLRKLDRFLTSVAARQGLLSLEMIDLRWNGEVVVRWKENEARG